MAVDEPDAVTSCSFNEIESLSKLAARGVGYPWCVAKETGRAVRWLAEYDLPASLILLQLIEQVDKVALSSIQPKPCSDGSYTSWRAEGQGLCPVLTGLSLVDFSGIWCSKSQVKFDGLFSTGLILPFAAQSSRLRNMELSVSWNGCQVFFKYGQLLIVDDDQSGFFKAIESGRASAVKMQCGSLFDNYATIASPYEPLVPRRHVERARIRNSLLKALAAYAARTYAPVTESSRLSGAGAGVSDND